MRHSTHVAHGMLLALVLTAGCAKERSPEPTPVAEPPKSVISFATQIQPMLKARCSPCHFTGGKMYEKMPFDRPETIRILGDRMFTRIKEEPDLGTLKAFLVTDARSF